jgi:hypothetical protein
MDQLTPTVTALPGHGTAALPWVNEIPQSLDASFAIKMEPHQDSCDGMAGTQGWSQVVVQSRFQWGQGLPTLVAYMEPGTRQTGVSCQASATGLKSTEPELDQNVEQRDKS